MYINPMNLTRQLHKITITFPPFIEKGILRTLSNKIKFQNPFPNVFIPKHVQYHKVFTYHFESTCTNPSFCLHRLFPFTNSVKKQVTCLGVSLKYKHQQCNVERCVRPNTYNIPKDAMFYIGELKTKILLTHFRIFYNFDIHAS